MRDIVKLFLMDVRSLGKNAIAFIVTLGLVLVPPMYAWFTTAGFWDPYSNTGNIKVAVANVDAGYRSPLLPMSINVGETVVSQLRANDKFDWEFMDEDDALDALKAGKCYAAIVIPESFSSDLMTVLSRDAKAAEILYYVNQRENAIAPRVTGAGATALETDIDRAFTDTVGSVALGMVDDLSSFLSGDGIENYGNALVTRLDRMGTELAGASQEARSFAALAQSAAMLADTSSQILQSLGSTTEEVTPLLDETSSALSEAADALEHAESLADEAFSSATQAFDGLETKVNAALGAVDALDSDAAAGLQSAAADLEGLGTVYGEAAAAVAKADPNSPLIARLDAAQASLAALSDDVIRASQELTQQEGVSDQRRNEIEQALNDARSSLEQAYEGYGAKLTEDMDALETSLAGARQTAEDLAGRIDVTAGDLSAASISLSENLESVGSALDATAGRLSEAAKNVTDSRDALAQALASGDIDKVRRLIGDDPSRIADFLTDPTELVRHAVYPMANNGTAMSPFYTALSLWIGALFMVVLTQVRPNSRRLSQLKNPTANKTFLGRFGVFWLVGAMQALIVCLGNVFFLGIEVQHFALYLLSGLVTALVFDAIVYTLTVSFGNVGKAVAIIALVAQLAGSGGILPVQLSAPFFQAVYPWLPMTYAMGAFQSTIAGIYGNQLAVDLLCLLAWLVPCLILGLVLRHPVIRFNEFIVRKLDETKLL